MNDDPNSISEPALNELAQSFPEDVQWARQSAEAMRAAMAEFDTWPWPDEPEPAQ